MPKHPPLTEQERADLVAYLDGELHGDAARKMEAKLNLYPEVRAEAESLRRAWEMLDFLPRTEASPHFTERTLSSIRPVLTGHFQAPPRHRWLFSLIWATAVVAAFFGGWGGYEWFISTASTTTSTSSTSQPKPSPTGTMRTSPKPTRK